MYSTLIVISVKYTLFINHIDYHKQLRPKTKKVCYLHIFNYQ